MLSIHLLNVGKGDSIVLEHEVGGERTFAVVDSFALSGQTPKALTKLRELRADRLSFVALTHPHRDHYAGLAEVMEEFRGRIDKVLSFPIARDRARLERLIQKYSEVVRNGAASTGVRTSAIQLIQFLQEAKDLDWEDPTGLFGLLDVEGFNGVEFSQVLPPAKVKGDLFQELDRGTYPLETPKQNELTLAILLTYAGVDILLGGDGIKPIWLSQSRSAERLSRTLKSRVVKMPHHGSSIDCDDRVLDVLFHDAGESNRYALISADGLSHPASTVLSSLKDRGILPYCTNLSKACGGGKVRGMAPLPELSPGLGRFINSVATDSTGTRTEPCQGDITIRIDPAGEVTVEREFDNLCGYRRDYENLALRLGAD